MYASIMHMQIHSFCGPTFNLFVIVKPPMAKPGEGYSTLAETLGNEAGFVNVASQCLHWTEWWSKTIKQRRNRNSWTHNHKSCSILQDSIIPYYQILHFMDNVGNSKDFGSSRRLAGSSLGWFVHGGAQIDRTPSKPLEWWIHKFWKHQLST